jgi:hypothetical protein
MVSSTAQDQAPDSIMVHTTTTGSVVRRHAAQADKSSQDASWSYDVASTISDPASTNGIVAVHSVASVLAIPAEPY